MVLPSTLLSEDSGRRAAPDEGLLASVRSILENVSALCGDNNDIEPASLDETPHAFHPWWVEEKLNQESKWQGSRMPGNKRIPCMPDLAQLLEPRPLPPSFPTQVNCSSSPSASARALKGSSNIRMVHRTSASQIVSAQKTKTPHDVPVLCSSSSPSSHGLAYKHTLAARSTTSEPSAYSLQPMDMKLQASFVSGPYSFSSSKASTASSTKCKSSLYSMHPMAMKLPESFTPGPYTVVIGRGREARQAPGNQRLRSLATTHIDDYSSASATEKSRKSQIVATICREIRVVCPEGAFVRFGPDGRWYEVPDSVAMEKVGYTLRELVGERYRSSSKAKKAARQESFATG